MAHELGYFKKFGIQSVISKEASWAVIRDKLSIGENQATHMLIGMPLASTMGLAGSPVKPMIIPWLLSRNGQAITLNNKLKLAGVRTPQALKPIVDQAKAAGEPMSFAMTFPPGTHAMWMRYWLASGGIHPDRDVTLITIPPPQMVANMKVGKMDGFCVGEPWNYIEPLSMGSGSLQSPRNRCGAITRKRSARSLRSSGPRIPKRSRRC
jgi:nitrate/nitrite transport system substrate-binding protein